MSDVKGWSPEYQSILETFDMINNKYENPDVSKDLNISHIGAWSNNTTSSLNTFGPFNWNTPLNPNFINASTVNFEIYCNIYADGWKISRNNISNFFHIYNNEKRDRMISVFQMSKMSNYNETEKPKRMEIGYYCKDKKEFKTLFNDQLFTNGKHIMYNNNDCYYLIHSGYTTSASKPTTIGQLLLSLKIKVYSSTSTMQSWVFRYFKTINNYLSNKDSKYSVRFIPSFNNEYSGGGVLTDINTLYENILNEFIKNGIIELRKNLILGKPDSYETGKLYYYTENPNLTDPYNDKESIFNDKCLNIHYTLDSLSLKDTDVLNVLKGNVINEYANKNNTYVIVNKGINGVIGISTPLLITIVSYKYIPPILNHKTYISSGNISMIKNVQYNVDEINGFNKKKLINRSTIMVLLFIIIIFLT